MKRNPSNEFFVPIFNLGVKNFVDSSLTKKEEKKVVKNFPIYQAVQPLNKVWGEAFPIFWTDTELRYGFSLTRNDKRVTIDKKSSYPIIVIDEKHFYNQEKYHVVDTILHETAHCVDFFFRGFENRSDSSFHDSEFYRLFSAFKGKIRINKIN